MTTLVPSSIALTEHNIKVMLVDDQRIVGETIRRMLVDIPGIEFHFCSDPAIALAEASRFQPTVILQDLIMPNVDGIDVVHAFRAQPSTSSTPLIVLSSKEEPTIKADAFAAGANDYLVKLPDKLELVARIRYHSAAYIHRLQRDEAFKVLEAQQRVIAQELADAAAYVRSLLPPPMASNSPVPANWRFISSSSLGGDSFGYHWLTPDELAKENARIDKDVAKAKERRAKSDGKGQPTQINSVSHGSCTSRFNGVNVINTSRKI